MVLSIYPIAVKSSFYFVSGIILFSLMAFEWYRSQLL